MALAFFSGSVPGIGSRHPRFINQLIAAIEAENCEVSREGNRLRVAVPGWESRLFDHGPGLRFFWDELEIELGAEGGLRFQWVYWRGSQAYLHVAISALVVAGYWSRSAALSSFLLALGGLNVAAYLLWLGSAWHVQQSLFQNVRRKLSS